MTDILTTHGINSKGPWQEDAKYVLKPHFECKPIGYNSYRRLGATKLFCEPWVLFPSAALIVVGLWAGYFEGSVFWLVGASVLVLVLSHAASYVRRSRTLRSYVKQACEGSEFIERRHLIAHSFGTFLSVRTLKEHPDFRLENIVLAGCVLSSRWPWKELLDDKPDAFKRVRNDVQRRDWVALLAVTLRGFIPGFGIAGFTGFREIPGFIHTSRSPNKSWQEYRPRGEKLRIHNVFCKDFGHSGVFMTRSYIALFWLPFFWDIEPEEYSLFLATCLSAARAERDENWPAVVKAEALLRRFEWSWAGYDLVELVRTQILAYQRRGTMPTEDLVDLVFAGIWKVFAIAAEAYHCRTAGWEHRVLALNPLVAVTRAVSELPH